MGLCAVVFVTYGRLAFLNHCGGFFHPVSRDGGRALNALVITRFGGAPLIVTLGTYSLFRGMAKGSRAAWIISRSFPPHSSISGRAILAARFRRRRPCSFFSLPSTSCCCIAASTGGHSA